MFLRAQQPGYTEVAGLLLFNCTHWPESGAAFTGEIFWYNQGAFQLTVCT